jgi:hypothetical protein
MIKRMRVVKEKGKWEDIEGGQKGNETKSFFLYFGIL